MKKKLSLPKKETLRALTQGVESAAGGTFSFGPTGNGCAGSNNSCEICYEN